MEDFDETTSLEVEDLARDMYEDGMDVAEILEYLVLAFGLDEAEADALEAYLSKLAET